MKPTDAQELIQLLKETRELALTFDIGTAYIRRGYIDKQAELTLRIAAAIEKLKEYSE